MTLFTGVSSSLKGKRNDWKKGEKNGGGGKYDDKQEVINEEEKWRHHLR